MLPGHLVDKASVCDTDAGGLRSARERIYDLGRQRAVSWGSKIPQAPPQERPVWVEDPSGHTGVQQGYQGRDGWAGVPGNQVDYADWDRCQTITEIIKLRVAGVDLMMVYPTLKYIFKNNCDAIESCKFFQTNCYISTDNLSI